MRKVQVGPRPRRLAGSGELCTMPSGYVYRVFVLTDDNGKSFVQQMLAGRNQPNERQFLGIFEEALPANGLHGCGRCKKLKRDGKGLWQIQRRGSAYRCLCFEDTSGDVILVSYFKSKSGKRPDEISAAILASAQRAKERYFAESIPEGPVDERSIA